nr:MAG TPA: hypothetical protein [Caudoviricetes sp.]
MKNKKQHTEKHTEKHTEISKFCCVYLLYN